ncbi:ryncolin-4-like isoform X1 [Scylla paramamosain]|uniref:ryncolin-4-like isoform X1 n=1 Tax=Scylla paramamosain TaxID=85552 RepID=UPI003082F338
MKCGSDSHGTIYNTTTTTCGARRKQPLRTRLAAVKYKSAFLPPPISSQAHSIPHSPPRRPCPYEVRTLELCTYLRESYLVWLARQSRCSAESNMRVSLYVIAVLGAAGVLAIRVGATREYVSPDTSPPEHATDIKLHPISYSIRPADCADLLLAGATVSGVYEIYPFMCTCGKPVRVWCDMETDGGGWTVFLNRQHQEVQLDFNRTWDDYKAGFGNPNSEYYLGNDVLHQMTNSRFYGIRLDMALPSGGHDFATHQYFKIDSEENRYLASLTGTKLEGTSSTNCLAQMNNRAFTSLDRDHDSSSNNCAVLKGGAWWYYSCGYLNPTSPFNMTLMLTCSGPVRAVTHLQVKIRPSTCDASFKSIHLKDMGCGCGAQAL